MMSDGCCDCRWAGLVRAPLMQPQSVESMRSVLDTAGFLYFRIYGRSRVLPLAALLQRQFRPTPPLPFRRDSLLISLPDWFVPRIRELGEMWDQSVAAELAAAAAAMEKEADE